jgi:hypothetical protein
MSTQVTDDARKYREDRANRVVANAVKDCKRRWGGGWYLVSEEIRRGAVCREVLSQMTVIETESPEVAVFCVAVASAAMRVEL